ncbi:MAG: hypothetical protein V4642_07120 [Bacteroidota bacterium]
MSLRGAAFARRGNRYTCSSRYFDVAIASSEDLLAMTVVKNERKIRLLKRRKYS